MENTGQPVFSTSVRREALEMRNGLASMAREGLWGFGQTTGLPGLQLRHMLGELPDRRYALNPITPIDITDAALADDEIIPSAKQSSAQDSFPAITR